MPFFLRAPEVEPDAEPDNGAAPIATWTSHPELDDADDAEAAAGEGADLFTAPLPDGLEDPAAVTSLLVEFLTKP